MLRLEGETGSIEVSAEQERLLRAMSAYHAPNGDRDSRRDQQRH